MPKAGPGMWHGHLAVQCEDHILDATLDQLDGLSPLAFPIEPQWDDGGTL